MLDTQLGDSNPHRGGDPSDAPHMKALRGEAQSAGQNCRAYVVDKRVMGMPLAHEKDIHGTLMSDNPQSLISINDSSRLSDEMKNELGARIRKRVKELKTTQVKVAEAAGMSPQRLGNYVQGTKLPDLVALVQIAKALNTSADWLLGLSETGPPEIEPILVRLLELEGMSQATAQTIAATVREAVAIQRALPNEGDLLLRSRLAAQAAWQSRRAPKPN